MLKKGIFVPPSDPDKERAPLCFGGPSRLQRDQQLRVLHNNLKMNAERKIRDEDELLKLQEEFMRGTRVAAAVVTKRPTNNKQESSSEDKRATQDPNACAKPTGITASLDHRLLGLLT